MKRWLWLIATGLIVGVALASFVSRDPGYVLLQVGGYRLETSLVALFLAVVGLLILLRLVGQLVRIILGVVPGFGRWLGFWLARICRTKSQCLNCLVRDSDCQDDFSNLPALPKRPAVFSLKTSSRLEWISSRFCSSLRLPSQRPNPGITPSMILTNCPTRRTRINCPTTARNKATKLVSRR